jgi:hypothetical protein
MAGGIFVDQPFHPNPKCIVFGTILMLGYWYLPKSNPFLLPLIFVIAYIAMAWYDYMYKCDIQLYSGTSIGMNTLDTWGKPQRRTEGDKGKDNSHIDQEMMYNKNVNLFHILAINTILIYIGYKGIDTNPQLFNLLTGITATALIYHGSRIFIPRQVTECPDEKSAEVMERNAYLRSVYFMHVAAIVPLLLYTGIRGVKSDKRVFPVLLALGIISNIYHSWRLYSPVKTIKC